MVGFGGCDEANDHQNILSSLPLSHISDYGKAQERRMTRRPVNLGISTNLSLHAHNFPFSAILDPMFVYFPKYGTYIYGVSQIQ